MTKRLWLGWIVWLLLIIGSIWQVRQTPVVTDLSSFLPGAANQRQKLMTEQLRDGISTRILIVGLRAPQATLTPETAAALATASERLRKALSNNTQISWATNGDVSALNVEKDLLFASRYLLSGSDQSNQANANLQFSNEGLKAALNRLQNELMSTRGAAIKAIAGADPTLHALDLLDKVGGQLSGTGNSGPWKSADGKAVIVLTETMAKGNDIDALRQTIASAKASAEKALADWPNTETLPNIEFAGASFFNVQAHDAITRDAERLSFIAIALVAAILWWTLRSPLFIFLAMIPVVTGALAGFAAIGLAYGSIHGITIAFGVTLIGEAVDYAIYTFVQRDDQGRHDTKFWGQIALAVITSLIGFAAMFFSEFQGLKQLGLFSMVGLIIAAATTRWLLPSLMPKVSASSASSSQLLSRVTSATKALQKFRWPLLITSGLIAFTLTAKHQNLWQDSLDSLSTSSSAQIKRDEEYRQTAGVPNLRAFVAVNGNTTDLALTRAQAVSELLQTLVNEKLLQGYDTPSTFIPSTALQKKRQDTLPSQENLTQALAQATATGNFSAAAFQQFLSDVQKAKTGPLIDLNFYKGSILGHWLNAQLVTTGNTVNALILLQGTPSLATINARLKQANMEYASVIDLTGDVEELVAQYRQQAMTAALAGAACIMGVLMLQLRRKRAVASVIATLICTVLITTGIVLLIEGYLTIFNLVALLLVAGVASNYTLFFSTLSSNEKERQRASLSVIIAASCTFLGFVMLATSSTPVLAMIGLTVSVGSAVGLLCSMAFSGVGPA
jgi:predicted exporter